jgi:hypothetical protein
VPERKRPQPTRTAYRIPDEAASVLGIGRDAFNAHVRPDLKLIRVGRLILVSAAELERWAQENERPALESDE